MVLLSLDQINAASTVVIALATVALSGVAYLQIKHRADEKREQRSRLDAVAKYRGLLLQRALRESVVALDALRAHTRTLASWRQQATLAFNFFVEARRELEALIAVMIERHGGTPAVIEEMLTGTLAAFDAARELAGPGAPAITDDEISSLYATARKRALVCLNRLEPELRLPSLPPLYQPTDAPGAAASVSSAREETT